MAESIRQLLDHYQQEGLTQAVDQDFTLATGRMLDKFSSYGFSEPGLWVVKFVQAAVAAGAQEIKITMVRHGISVRIDGDIGATPRQLLEMVTSTRETLTPALRHLVSGIRAAYSPSRTILWACQGESGPEAVRLVGGSGPVLGKVSKPEPGFTFLYSEESAQTKKSFFSRPPAAEVVAVSRRCIYSPIPVHCDGRRVDRDPGIGGAARWEAVSGREELAPFSIPRPEPNGRPVAMDGEKAYWENWPKAGQFQLDRRVEEGAGDLLLLLPPELAGESRLFFLHDGALIDGPELLSHLGQGYGLSAIVHRPVLKTDLSEFRALGSHRTLVAAVRKEAELMAATFLTCHASPKLRETTIDKKKVAAGAIGIGLLAKAPIALGALSLPLAAITGVGYYTYSRMAKTQRSLDNLDWANRLRALQRELKSD